MSKIHLINFLSTLLTLPSSITQTIQINNDLEIPIPTQFMNLKTKNNLVYFCGLVDYGILPDIKGYNTITITNNINVIYFLNNSFIDKRLNEITKINYSENPSLLAIDSASICNLANLNSLVIPNSVKYIGKDAIINCPKLNTIDFSSFEKDESFMSPLIFDKSIPKNISSTGTIYVKNTSIKESVETKFHDLEIFRNWNILIK